MPSTELDTYQGFHKWKLSFLLISNHCVLGIVLGVGELGGRIQRWVKGQLGSIPYPTPSPATLSTRLTVGCATAWCGSQSLGGECHWLGVPPMPSSSPLPPLLEPQLNVSARPQAEQGMYFQVYMKQGLGCQCCVDFTWATILFSPPQLLSHWQFVITIYLSLGNSLLSSSETSYHLRAPLFFATCLLPDFTVSNS